MMRSRMAGRQEGQSHGRTTSQSVAESAGWSEALKPILTDMPTSTFTLEEQRHRFAVAIRQQEQGQAAVQLLDAKAVFLSTPTPRRYPTLPSMHARALAAILERSGCMTALPDVEREIGDRYRALEAAVRAHAGHPFTGGAVDLQPEDTTLG